MGLRIVREKNEGITIPLPDGREIKLRVKKLKTGRVEFDITAPREIDIWRDELYEDKKPSAA